MRGYSATINMKAKLPNFGGTTVFMVLAVFAMLSLSLPTFAQYRTETGSYEELYDSETTAALRHHIRSLSSADTEGRAPGSDGEKAAAEYVAKVLSSKGIEMLDFSAGNTFGVTLESGDTLTSRNVIGYIQGSDPKLRDHYVVIGARLDNLGSDNYTVDGVAVERIYYGANGNASGLAMMLELAGMLSHNSFSLKRSVIFIAFGASTRTYAGAWYFLNRAFSETANIDAMINLDCIGCGNNGFYAYTASNADMNTLLRSLEGDLLPIRPELTSAETYPSDHRAFYAKEIPSVCFTTGKYPEHGTERDTEAIIDYPSMERILEYLYDFSTTLANTGIRPSFYEKVTAPKRNGVDYDGVMPYYECDRRPTFLGSADPRQFLSKWVYQYLKYPSASVRNGVQGTVMVDFIIEKDGQITNVKVSRSVSEELDAEAVKVISASPKWKPGRVDGNKVRCSMTLPVEFRLEKNSKGGFGVNNIRVR